jgi:CubicO group peptidase (beta-lactamase class C family)
MKNKTFKIIAGIAIILFYVYAFLPRYAQRALIYTTADIDDYKIFDNRTIKAGDPMAWPVHNQFNSVGIPDSWIDSLAKFNTVAYAIIKDSSLLLDAYWQGYNQTSWSNSFSAAKSIIGFAILSAVDRGFIESLDQPVAAFVPEFDNEANRNLSIRDVLTMSSGLNWTESYSGLFNTTTESYYGKDLTKLIIDLKVVEEPGKVFSYKSGDTQLLSMVLRNATGMSVSDYISKYFWTPMHAEHDALWSLDDKDGVEKAYCCFNSNVRDFARWGQLMLNHGRWGEKQLISDELMNLALSPATHLVNEKGEKVDYYGFQVWMMNYKGYEVKYMRGILGQYVFAIPELNMVIVRLGEKRSDQRIGEHPADVAIYLELALELAKDL